MSTYVLCVAFCVQTGVISTRPPSFSNFHHYRIAKDKLPELRRMAENAPELPSADLDWLDRNEVFVSRAIFDENYEVLA